MTIVTSETEAAAVAVPGAGERWAGGAGRDLVGQLVAQARAGGLQLTGEGGLLQQLTKRVLESALEGEITDHLGYEQARPGRAGQRQLPQRHPGQDGADRGRPGRDRGAPGPGGHRSSRRSSRSGSGG